jgi:hypothetical protein
MRTSGGLADLVQLGGRVLAGPGGFGGGDGAGSGCGRVLLGLPCLLEGLVAGAAGQRKNPSGSPAANWCATL